MIIENTGVKGLQSELGYLDEAMNDLGFIRWQWEYNRATYDMKYTDREDEYFLRVNARVLEGRLEAQDAILSVEDAYIGKVTFPHGLDYNAEIPASVMNAVNEKLKQLKEKLV